MAIEGLSDRDVQQFQAECERRILASVALAQLQISAHDAPTNGVALQSGAGGVPDFPPDPPFFPVMGKYVVEAVNHLPDTTGLIGGIGKLLATAYGRDLLARLVAAVTSKRDDPKLWQEFLQYVLPSSAYGSLLIGVLSEAQVGARIVGVTGVAIPLRAGSKVKWFSGAEKSIGLALSASTGLLIGERLEVPTELTGQFYGGHIGVDVAASLGSSLYFDTSSELRYKGFSTQVGVGVGFSVSTLSGWELVTSD